MKPSHPSLTYRNTLPARLWAVTHTQHTSTGQKQHQLHPQPQTKPQPTNHSHKRNPSTHSTRSRTTEPPPLPSVRRPPCPPATKKTRNEWTEPDWIWTGLDRLTPKCLKVDKPRPSIEVAGAKMQGSACPGRTRRTPPLDRPSRKSVGPRATTRVTYDNAHDTHDSI